MVVNPEALQDPAAELRFEQRTFKELQVGDVFRLAEADGTQVGEFEFYCVVEPPVAVKTPKGEFTWSVHCDPYIRPTRNTWTYKDPKTGEESQMEVSAQFKVINQTADIEET